MFNDQIMNNLTYAMTPKTVEQMNIGVLVIGGPGSGKTRLASTAPTPQLVLDFDHGLTTYTSEGLVQGKDFYPYTFDKFQIADSRVGNKKVLKSQGNIDAVLQILSMAADRSGPFTLKCKACNVDGQIEDKDGNVECPYCKGTKLGVMSDVKTIVIDGFTSLSDYFLYEIMVDRLNLNYDKDKPGYDGYGQLLRALGNVCELLIACRQHYHVVGTTLVKWEQRPGSSSDGDVIANPDLDGSFRNKIGKVLDEFYALESKEVGRETQYFLYSQPTRTIPNLKSRSQLPNKLQDPHFDKIIASLNDAHTKKRRNG